MYFNSWQFVVFFALVYAGYLVLPTRRAQNVLLLAASYVFYAAWDWRFLGLIILSTGVDYLCGRAMGATTAARRRRTLLVVSMVVNLGLLAVFKYSGFFVESLEDLIRGFGLDPGNLRLDVVLPVGISFYTFQTMSYTIDVYRRELEPSRDLLDFALFVAFFPQLVAGPIERARNLLPQVHAPRRLDPTMLRTGTWLIAFGLWKKVFIADNLAPHVDRVFANSAAVDAGQAYLGVVAFAFQIYCDFSGYTDIARGLSRLLGFELMRNFDLPYVARNPSDFWRRWHISLSTWLRDYLYIPLGGNRGGELRTSVNLMITMLLGGLWHGASWNFVWWGFFHGAILVVHRALTRGKRRAAEAATRLGGALSAAVMFQFTLFGWLLFRATRRVETPEGTQDDSARQIAEMLTSGANGWWSAGAGEVLVAIAAYASPLVAVQALQLARRDHYAVLALSRPWRALCYALLAYMLVAFGAQTGSAFIYFQF